MGGQRRTGASHTPRPTPATAKQQEGRGQRCHKEERWSSVNRVTAGRTGGDDSPVRAAGNSNEPELGPKIWGSHWAKFGI